MLHLRQPPTAKHAIIISLFSLLVVITLIARAGVYADTSAPLPCSAPSERSGTAQLTFLDWQCEAISGTVRVLCYDDANRLLADITVETLDGHPQDPAALADCNRMTALHLVHTQPSGKSADRPAYSIYEASGDFSVGSLQPVPRPAGSLVLRRPLILFNVVVSLEWEADAAYIESLYGTLRRTSAYLADLTEGYMAFGQVAIYRGGQAWEQADLRVLVTNDARPSAFVGGIVATPINRYITRMVDGQAIQPTFKPGAAYLGRAWDGVDAYRGTDESYHDYRTIGHEWAHYALFLFDEYQSHLPVDSTFRYCVPGDLNDRSGEADLASAMSFQYTASELWHPLHAPTPPGICYQTDQYRTHGQSDWQTLQHWYEIQALDERTDLPPLSLPASLPKPGPALTPTPGAAEHNLEAWGPIRDLFVRGAGLPYTVYLPLITMDSDGGDAPAHPAITLTIDDEEPFTKTFATQVYLLKDGLTADTPTRILYQGTVVGQHALPGEVVLGQTALWDATSADSLRIFADRYAFQAPDLLVDGGRFLYAGAAPTADETITAPSNDWGSSLDVIYQMRDPFVAQRLDMMKFVLSGDRNSDLIGSPPIVRICVPEVSIGCSAEWQFPLDEWDGVNWSATWALPLGQEVPPYGVINVSADHPDFDGLIRWFRDDGGVGTGHMHGGTSRREGGGTVDTVDLIVNPAPGPCNRVVTMPAADYTAQTTAPSDNFAIVGIPLEVDILFGTDVNQQCTSGSPADKVLPSMRLTLFYNQDTLDRFGINEPDLKILQYQPNGNGWIVHPTVSSAAPLGAPDPNWVSAEIIEDGIYAIGWQPTQWSLLISDNRAEAITVQNRP